MEYPLMNRFFILQSAQLISNLERYLFWSYEDLQLYLSKYESLSQFFNMRIKINAKGLMEVNRQTLSSVSIQEFVGLETNRIIMVVDLSIADYRNCLHLFHYYYSVLLYVELSGEKNGLVHTAES